MAEPQLTLAGTENAALLVESDHVARINAGEVFTLEVGGVALGGEYGTDANLLLYPGTTKRLHLCVRAKADQDTGMAYQFAAIYWDATDFDEALLTTGTDISSQIYNRNLNSANTSVVTAKFDPTFDWEDERTYLYEWFVSDAPYTGKYGGSLDRRYEFTIDSTRFVTFYFFGRLLQPDPGVIQLEWWEEDVS